MENESSIALHGPALEICIGKRLTAAAKKNGSQCPAKRHRRRWLFHPTENGSCTLKSAHRRTVTSSSCRWTIASRNCSKNKRGRHTSLPTDIGSLTTQRYREGRKFLCGPSRDQEERRRFQPTAVWNPSGLATAKNCSISTVTKR